MELCRQDGSTILHMDTTHLLNTICVLQISLCLISFPCFAGKQTHVFGISIA